MIGAVVMCILGLIGAVQLSELIGDGGPLVNIPIGIVYIILSIIAGVFFGTTGVIILGVVGIIMGIIFFIITKSSGSSSSYSSSSGSSSYNYMQSRQNDPHTCGNCTKYSSGRGECRLSGNSMSAGDSCGNWC